MARFWFLGFRPELGSRASVGNDFSIGCRTLCRQIHAHHDTLLRCSERLASTCTERKRVPARLPLPTRSRHGLCEIQPHVRATSAIAASFYRPASRPLLPLHRGLPTFLLQLFPRLPLPRPWPCLRPYPQHRAQKSDSRSCLQF